MAEYKKLNLKEDVENMSERFGLAPNMEARFARNAMDLQGGGFSYQKLAPGFQAPFGHKHERQEEVYVIVSGSGRVKIDDDVVDLNQWDVITFAPQKVRAFEAGPEGLELLAIGFGEGGDADMVQDFWSA